MRHSDLRRRLLLALGLPVTIGCAGGAGGGAPPPWHGAGTGTGTGTGGVIANDVPDALPGSCAPDHLPETICGGVEHGSCGATGDRLTSYGESSLHVTVGSYGAHDPTFAPFAYDDDATAAYRQRLARDHQGLQLDRYCCYSQCTPLVVARDASLDVPPGFHAESRCLPPPPGGTAAPAEANAACPGAVALGGVLAPHDGSAHGCCYSVAVADPPEEPRYYRGRPARVSGDVRLPDVAPARAWGRAPSPAVARLDAATRDRLAAAWTETARMEHASVAAFSNLSLRLMAAGAPPELIAAAHQAALDEIEHARVAFGFAAAYAGEPVGPAPFPAAAAMTADGGLDALAVETFVDGCIGETVAAAEARWASRGATDPAIAAALATIAEDETRHAELAWAIVGWCVRAQPRLARRLADALAAERAAPPAAPADAGAPDLAAHGILSAADLAALRREIVRDVVEPCLAALIAPA